MNHAIDLAVGCHYFLPGLRLPPQLSPDGATCKRQHTSDSSLLLIYRPRKDERLSWPSWLTYSGRFTHISGHPSAAGRAQDRESSPARPMFYHCATPPTESDVLTVKSGIVRSLRLSAVTSDVVRSSLASVGNVTSSSTSSSMSCRLLTSVNVSLLTTPQFNSIQFY